MVLYGLEIEVWLALTTILLSIVSIIIAICSTRSTAKQANKQIAEIKRLAKLQIDAACISLDAEISKIEKEKCKLEDDLVIKRKYIAEGKNTLLESLETQKLNAKRIETDINNHVVLINRYKRMQLLLQQELEKN